MYVTKSINQTIQNNEKQTEHIKYNIYSKLIKNNSRNTEKFEFSKTTKTWSFSFITQHSGSKMKNKLFYETAK